MGNIYTTIYPASGSSVDWTYGQDNVLFSFAVELVRMLPLRSHSTA
jgi:hypothetical protein